MRAKPALLLTAALLGVLGAIFAWHAASGQPDSLPQGADPYFTAAQADLQQRLAQRPILGEAKNVILFIGDGMSIGTLTAARIYAGQKRGRDGVSYRLAMESLPYSALSRTYADDSQVTDSAPSATAMTTGVKSANDSIGLDRNAILDDCASAEGTRLLTLFEMAEMAGLSTGIVTTSRITHATPAAAYAHTPQRNWEADTDMPDTAKTEGCTDIAAQLVEWDYGDGFEVALGGGRTKLLPADTADPEYGEMRGERGDGRDLTQEWLGRNADSAYVWNKSQFDGVDPAATRHLLGLFEPVYMQYESGRAKDTAGEPSLAEMTEKAIAILSDNPDGYFLMVEGGLIDLAHHNNNAARALEDTDAFDAAISAALGATNPEDTLIVVTADHGHALSILGYPARGNPILGLAAGRDGEPFLAADGKPYTTLVYGTGPGTAPGTAGTRPDLTGTDTAALDYRQQSLVPMPSAMHDGADVAIFARGPYAHLFQGVVDQNFIYHVMAHASRIPEKAGVR